MSGRIRVCRPDQVGELIAGALAGDYWLAPVADAQSDLDWLRPDLPEPSADGGVIVATSGSTGQPKGVCLPAAALIASARATAEVVPARDWVAVLPLQWVAGLMTVVRAHLAGGQVVVASSDLVGVEPPSDEAAISLVGTQLERALHHREQMTALAGFSAVLVGGSAIAEPTIERARAAGIAIITTYGMSETAGGCVYDGIPLPGVEVHVGESGRIDIAGLMVSSGYRLRPELTKEALPTPGRVVTQDRGRWQNGRLQILGRLDEVVISGGVNVDLAQVSRRVEQWSQGEATVVAVPDDEWGTRLLLVIADAQQAPNPPLQDPPPQNPPSKNPSLQGLAQWQAALREAGFDSAALPRGLLRVDHVPRTLSGKLDRRALDQVVESIQNQTMQNQE